MTSIAMPVARHTQWPAPIPPFARVKQAAFADEHTSPQPLPPFKHGQSIDVYLEQMQNASTVQLIEMERQGVPHAFIAALSERMDVPLARMQKMMRVSKATAARKRADDAGLIGGAAGATATAIVKLIGMAQRIVDQSTAPQANGFDVQKWFGTWIELPQPALNGNKPADLLDTPSGVEAVARVLGALESGAYQ
jgi:uncharacterized protein (DUF2384 family)